MRLLKPVILAVTMLLASVGLAQIPAPQINLGGNIGCQGFPCLNSGTLIMASDANRTMTAQETSAMYIKVTSSVSLTATRNLIAPAGRFNFTIENATSGGQAIQIIGASGTGITIANGATVSVWNDGTNYVTSSTTYTPTPTNCSTTTFSATPNYAFTVTSPCTAMTMTANVTSSTISGMSPGTFYILELIQDATGNRTFAPPTALKSWPTDINRAPNGKTYCVIVPLVDGSPYVQSCRWV